MLRKLIALLSGIATPSEAMTLLEHGVRHMKFFPAESAGGVSMLKATGGPLPQIIFCPAGGLKPLSSSMSLGLPRMNFFYLRPQLYPRFVEIICLLQVHP